MRGLEQNDGKEYEHCRTHEDLEFFVHSSSFQSVITKNGSLYIDPKSRLSLFRFFSIPDGRVVGGPVEKIDQALPEFEHAVDIDSLFPNAK
jgi:hypothetical protein